MATINYALHKSRVVLASAGTGKTYTLVETYLGLLVGLDGREPLRPSQVLALTFTDRAAAQMRQRVLSRVRELRHAGPARDTWLKDHGARAALKTPDELARLEPQVMSAPICTFHSFCGRLLREFAAQCGTPLSPTMLDGPGAGQLLSEACLEAVTASMNDADVDATFALVDEMGLGSRSGLLTALEEVQKRMGERGLSVEDLVLCARPTVDAFADEVVHAVRLIQGVLGLPQKTPSHREHAEILRTAVTRLTGNDDVDERMNALRDAYDALKGTWGGGPVNELRSAAKFAIRRAVGAWSLQQSLHVGGRFRTLLVRTYSTSISAYRNQTIEVKPLKMVAGDKDTTVRTAVLQQGGPPIPIDYAMEKGGTGWKVYDVTIAHVTAPSYAATSPEQIVANKIRAKEALYLPLLGDEPFVVLPARAHGTIEPALRTLVKRLATLAEIPTALALDRISVALARFVGLSIVEGRRAVLRRP